MTGGNPLEARALFFYEKLYRRQKTRSLMRAGFSSSRGRSGGGLGPRAGRLVGGERETRFFFLFLSRALGEFDGFHEFLFSVGTMTLSGTLIMLMAYRKRERERVVMRRH